MFQRISRAGGYDTLDSAYKTCSLRHMQIIAQGNKCQSLVDNMLQRSDKNFLCQFNGSVFLVVGSVSRFGFFVDG
jgi:hypothetical protein